MNGHLRRIRENIHDQHVVVPHVHDVIFILIMIQVEFKTHVTGLMVQMQNQYMGWLLLSWWFSHGGSLMVVRSGFLSRFLSRFHLCKVLFLVVVPKGYW